MATYFISAAGNDSNSGLTSALPWLTIGKVNGFSQANGDIYQFRGGDTFNDATLTAASSGVTFTSYGTGRATISRSASKGFTTTNFDNITVSNLIFVGSGGTGNGATLCGVDCLYTSGSHTGLTLSNLSVSGFASSGIRVHPTTGTIDTVLITDCVCFSNTFSDVGPDGTAGILCWGVYGADHSGIYQLSNVTIQRCVSHDNPGTASNQNWSGSSIFLGECNVGLITGCVGYNGGTASTNIGTTGIWTADAKFVTIQYCESYNQFAASGQTDGDGFFMDGGSRNCIIQYCYAHDNYGHGFGFESYDDPGFIVQTSDCIIRFCVSEHNGRGSTFNQGGIYVGTLNASSAPNLRAQVYGNTVYGSTTTNFCPCFEMDIGTAVCSGTIANNIFYAASPSELIDFVHLGSGNQLQFNGNLYFSTGTFIIWWTPGATQYNSLAAWRAATGQDAQGLQANPGLRNPGGGGTINTGSSLTPGILANLRAYRITPSSPAYQKGLNLSSVFGINPGPVDFYSNQLSLTPLSIGADDTAPLKLGAAIDYLGDPSIVIIDWGPQSHGQSNPPLQIVTVGKTLTLPVNCVLDGQQREPVSKLMGLDGAITGPLKGIFGE